MIHVIGIQDNLYLLQTYHQNLCQTAFTRKSHFQVFQYHQYRNSTMVPKLHTGTKTPQWYRNSILGTWMKKWGWTNESQHYHSVHCLFKVREKNIYPLSQLIWSLEHKLSLVKEIVCIKKSKLVWCCLDPLMIWH